MQKQKKQNLNKIHFIILLILFCSCSAEVNKEYGTSLFSFSSAKNVKCISNSQYSGFCIFDDTDTAYFNFGYNINTLAEEIPELVILPDVSDDELADIRKKNTDFKYFSNVRNFDKDKLKKQNLQFIHTEMGIWKYSMPIDTLKNGMIGVFIDSVFIDSVSIDKQNPVKFNFYLKELKNMSYSEADKIIKSIILNYKAIEKTNFFITNVME